MAKLRLSYPSFRLPPTTSGSGSLRTLADLPALADFALFVSSQASVQALVNGAIEKGGRQFGAVVVKPSGEPTRESIEDGAGRLRGRPWAGIVAVGGGSVLDWARLSWARSVGLLDLEQGSISGEQAPSVRPQMVLVPSTFASGAEGASVAVYTAGDRKQAVVSPFLNADRVILDGRFLASLDDVQLSACFADAMSHAIESTLSIVPNGMAKMMAGAALRTLLRLADGGPPATSRADRLLEASFLAGGAASHASVGIGHAFAHALAAEGVPHGQGNALGLVPALLCNEAAGTMSDLLDEASLDHVTLVSRVRRIVRPAFRAAMVTTAPVLADPVRYEDVARRMLEDVAIRSNPIRGDGDLVRRFLDLVSEEIALV